MLRILLFCLALALAGCADQIDRGIARMVGVDPDTSTQFGAPSQRAHPPAIPSTVHVPTCSTYQSMGKHGGSSSTYCPSYTSGGVYVPEYRSGCSTIIRKDGTSSTYCH